MTSGGPRERKMPWLPSRTHRPGLREGRKVMRAEATAWNQRRVDEIDQELPRAIGDEREALVEERRLLLKDINRNPAPVQATKTPAQLDAEIADILAKPPASDARCVVTRSKVYPRPARPGFAWKYVYDVTIPGEPYPFGMETLSQVKSLCKRKAPSLPIHYAWKSA